MGRDKIRGDRGVLGNNDILILTLSQGDFGERRKVQIVGQLMR